MDVLDASLSSDLTARGSLDDSIIERFLRLGDYAASSKGEGGQAQAILFTCSAFGPAIDAVKAAQNIPVLRPNEAAFQEALSLGTRLALVVSFPPSLPALTAELREMAAKQGKTVEITPILAEGALAALKAADSEAHDQAVLAACADLKDVDAIILGQFSLARAETALSQVTQCPILTTPDCAVLALRSLFDEQAHSMRFPK
ncbi:aspartate/glutamate racemase family protein [Ruegeria sp.]|uniref:aspartate/glutamate racemase family protein n=1 Tax=Ruegeria sp. TaxID=1879320 RepID=UPI00231FEA77|nr:aspartate/glutamate racemase family protein [Ruegeria sp.]MDA7964310.1 aspartate/glutamate racemase family protein [Ruegeria sp.]